VEIKSPQRNIIIENDFVFAMTGYHPDSDFLKNVGVNLSNDVLLLPQFDSETYESDVENLFLAGVVCCGMDTSKWFIENSREHALKILEAIRKR
jgi:thioredoxin reductase (NADPH)